MDNAKSAESCISRIVVFPRDFTWRHSHTRLPPGGRDMKPRNARRFHGPDQQLACSLSRQSPDGLRAAVRAGIILASSERVGGFRPALPSPPGMGSEKGNGCSHSARRQKSTYATGANTQMTMRTSVDIKVATVKWPGPSKINLMPRDQMILRTSCSKLRT